MERHQFEDLGMDRGIILKLISKNWNGEAWERFIWLRTGGRWRELVNAVMNIRFK
jgi:hypothetical protein